MKVLSIVMAGGKGSRLRPLTFIKPKVLFPAMGGRRVIDFSIESGFSHNIPGIEVETVVLARYKSGQVARYVIRKYPSVAVLVGSKPFGTGGEILQHWKVLREREPDFVVILNGDHFVQLPLGQILKCCEETPHPLLMVGIPSDEEYHDYINVQHNSSVVLSKFSTRKSRIAFTGITVIRFDALRERMDQLKMGYCDLTQDVVSWIYEKHGGIHYILENKWRDLGTWGRYLGFLYRELNGSDSGL